MNRLDRFDAWVTGIGIIGIVIWAVSKLIPWKHMPWDSIVSWLFWLAAAVLVSWLSLKLITLAKRVR